MDTISRLLRGAHATCMEAGPGSESGAEAYGGILESWESRTDPLFNDRSRTTPVHQRPGAGAMLSAVLVSETRKAAKDSASEGNRSERGNGGGSLSGLVPATCAAAGPAPRAVFWLAASVGQGAVAEGGDAPRRRDRRARKAGGAAAVAPALSALRGVCAGEDGLARPFDRLRAGAGAAGLRRERESPMMLHALHATPRTGGSCAPTCRTVRPAWKNAVWCHEQRATPSPAHRARCVDRTVTPRVARVTATSHPTQSA